ncbi:MAG TPA: alpha/beta hydrolase [Steroidobacteraceae bacterium]|nr:alpha/beta hydrolase [Steroidobacteraceae bacterium]
MPRRARRSAQPLYGEGNLSNGARRSRYGAFETFEAASIVVKSARLIALVMVFIASPTLAGIDVSAQIPSEVYTHAAEMFAVDGQRRLNMYCVGTGAPTIVFISGAWQNTMTWRRVQGRASQSSRACSYDRAGLGFSDPATRESTAENAVADLKNLLDAAKVKAPVVLVGHSVGGLYALLFAASYRDRVAGIVLVDPSDPEANNNLALSGHLPRNIVEETRRQTETNHQLLRNCVDLAAKGILTLSNTDSYCLMNEADPILKKELDRQHVRLQTKEAILSEMISQDAMIEGEYSLNGLQFRKAIGNGGFGELPLILLRRANGQKHPALPQEIFEKNGAVFSAGYKAMVAYSSIGIVRPISESGHSIQLDQPEAVVKAIEEVFAAIHSGI